MRITSVLAAAAIAGCLSTPCFAWGHEGHEIVALIAARELSPSAKTQIEDLLGAPDAGPAMERVSTWADEIRRQRRNTAP